MKRTFTAAAAVLASSAGAVGLAATANAADTPQLPAELPTDNNLAQTTYHVAGTVHSAKRTVGDVVPVEEHLTGRTAPGGPLDGLGDILGGSPLRGVLGGARSLDPTNPLGVVPVGEVLGDQSQPASRTTGVLPPEAALAPGQAAAPQTRLPSGTELVDEAVDGVVAGTSLGRHALPLSRSGDALNNLTEPLGITGNLPLGKSAPTSPLDTVNDLLSHGPLGGTNQLG
ncbi:hypothetical protein GCM10011581_00370 [Saccharopolyspora subtropica]|uniref:Secreted protein n=1 Tax=Saccharopolyspora thermophila TaxID=89367 RepID=A0A917JJP7_9PSEU|nr:hypothetical protein [Saccharopolyspora subtropica]GGI67460.1 hypothetical protein GCM10011581_00370 [Saccharopolyspora subtropica]